MTRARGGARRRPQRRKPWRLFAHTSDIGLAVRGSTLRRLFENAGTALCDLVAGDRRRVAPNRRVPVAVSGSAIDDLLVRFLQELLFLQETRGWRFRGCAITSFDRRRFALRGRAVGEPFDPLRHLRRPEIKAVTYHGLRLVRRGGAWSVRLILDV